MTVFKASGRKKRLFKISPVHHHFELTGWPETTVIIRFWLIAGMFVAIAGDLHRRLHPSPGSGVAPMTAPTGTGRALVYGMAIAGRRQRLRWSPAAGTSSSPTTVRPSPVAPRRQRRWGRPTWNHRRRVTCPACWPPSSWSRRARGYRRHILFEAATAAGVPMRSEIDLAWEWEQARPGGLRPMLAVTGTDGKTTTTLPGRDARGHRMLSDRRRQHRHAARPALDLDVDVFVVECTSFRLATTTRFRPNAAVWLNLAEDHQDWHVSMASYRAAKARMVVPGSGRCGHRLCIRRGGARGAGSASIGAPHVRLSGADYRMVDHGANGAAGARLVGPGGVIASTGGMRRSLPHDVTNTGGECAGARDRPRDPEGSRRRSLPSWERHIASNWSGTTAPCATTTTPRRRRPTPR